MPFEEPNMSDNTLLMSVEDLINIAMGPEDKNIVNFKVVQTVLHILARQQRMLQQRVEIRITEVRQESPPPARAPRKSKKGMESEDSSPSSSPRPPLPKKRVSTPREDKPKDTTKVDKEKVKTEKDSKKREEKEKAKFEKEREKELRAQEKAEQSARKEKDKTERAALKEREKAERAASKEREKAERAASKEREKAERAASKEREKAERAASKEREKEERAASKERQKAEKAASKEREKAEKASSREREKEERSASKERDKEDSSALKEREKAEKAASKEREKEERSALKEREKEERAASKERDKAEKAASREREKEERSASKEREKAERAASKEREKEERSALKEREKAERAASKDRDKEERSATKEREKAERAASKEREKEERSASKEREKAERAASKEREKEERSASKEREKAERAATKEREKEEKAERKEKERAEMEAARAQKEKERSERYPSPAAAKDKRKSRVEAVPGINISEVQRGKEKVLVVEKGPTTRSETRARGGIDVVTQSQFALLEAAVQGLMQKAAPMAELRMPDNQNLKSALVKGSASLTDTMQAMQVNARVKAAEEAIDRMAGLLTQLAAAGAVPEALADRVAEAKREAERTLTSDTDDSVIQPVKLRPATARKSVAIDPMAKMSELARPSTATAARASSAPTPRASISTVMGRASVVSQPSSTVTALPDPKVTRGEMEDIVKSVKNDLWKSMNAMTMKAISFAESAMQTAKAVADRLEVVLKLDTRISTLRSLVSDYAEQLGGFDAGLTTQMQSFQEQMVQIRSDLGGGLKLLESVNNNAETAAVMELTERFEELVSDLERTTSAHRSLADFQNQLGDELRRLVECVEMLREQKADRDEVIDGLRDKADSSRLAGLLTEAEFALARAELDRRLEVCHDKFRRQDAVWMGAMKELLKTTDLKAELIDLLSMREDTQWQLRDLHSKLRQLAAVLGEPKAALLTRQLARDATCGACGAAAFMGMQDPGAGQPPAMPALRPQPPPHEEPCLRDLRERMSPELADHRHICLRWCGGSHTLVSERTAREAAPPLQLEAPPTRKFVDYGRDGRIRCALMNATSTTSQSVRMTSRRLYMLEEELQPCQECNAVLEAVREPPVGEEGAGDRGTRKTTIP